MGRAGDYPDYKEVYGFGGFRLLASRQETNIPLVEQRTTAQAATTVVKQSSQASGKKAGLCIWLRFIEGLSDL